MNISSSRNVLDNKILCFGNMLTLWSDWKPHKQNTKRHQRETFFDFDLKDFISKDILLSDDKEQFYEFLDATVLSESEAGEEESPESVLLAVLCSSTAAACTSAYSLWLHVLHLHLPASPQQQQSPDNRLRVSLVGRTHLSARAVLPPNSSAPPKLHHHLGPLIYASYFESGVATGEPTLCLAWTALADDGPVDLPAGRIDTGLSPADVLCCGPLRLEPGADPRLAVLRADGTVLGLSEDSPFAASPLPKKPFSLAPPNQQAAALLSALCTSSRPEQELVAVCAALRTLSRQQQSDAVLGHSAGLADSAPRGQHWATEQPDLPEDNTRLGSEYQLAAVQLAERLRGHHSLLLAATQATAPLLPALQRPQFCLLLAHYVASVMVNSQQRPAAQTDRTGLAVLYQGVRHAVLVIRKESRQALAAQGLSVADAFFGKATRVSDLFSGAAAVALQHKAGGQALGAAISLHGALERATAALADVSFQWAEEHVAHAALLELLSVSLGPDGDGWRRAGLEQGDATRLAALCGWLQDKGGPRRNLAEAQSVCTSLLLSLGQVRTAFRLAATAGYHSGLFAAIEQQEVGLQDSLWPELFELIKQDVSAHPGGSSLLRATLDRLEQKGRFRQLFEIGAFQPSQLEQFLSTRPQLAWRHKLQRGEHRTAAKALLQHGRDTSDLLTAETLYSLAKLACVVAEDSAVASAQRDEACSELAVLQAQRQLSQGREASSVRVGGVQLVERLCDDLRAELASARGLMKDAALTEAGEELVGHLHRGLALCSIQYSGAAGRSDSTTAAVEAAVEQLWALALRLQEGALVRTGLAHAGCAEAGDGEDGMFCFRILLDRVRAEVLQELLDERLLVAVRADRLLTLSNLREAAARRLQSREGPLLDTVCRRMERIVDAVCKADGGITCA